MLESPAERAVLAVALPETDVPAPQHLDWRALDPDQQFRPMAVQDGDPCIVLDVPEPTPNVGFAQQTEVGK